MRLAKVFCPFISRNWLFALFVVFIVHFTTAVATAAKNAEPVIGDIDQPMQFVVVRSNNSGCEPTCPQWVWARGAIEPGTPAAFARVLKTIGKKRLPVVISSPGGDVDAAMKMGRMIRERKFDVGVGTAYLNGCPTKERGCLDAEKKSGVYSGVIIDYGAYCNSACPLVLAGGVRRLAGPTTYVGVHQITTTYTKEKVLYRERYRIVKGKKRVVEKKVVSRKKVGSYQTTKLPKATERKVLAYLKEMGVAKSYFAAAQGTPAKDMRQLFPPEMLEMSLTTGDEAAVVFTRAGLCDQPVPASHCVELKRTPTTAPAVAVPPVPAAFANPEDSSMKFAVIRSAAPGCEPVCPEWISAEGIIDPQSPARLQSVLNRLGQLKLPIVLHSADGDLGAAMALGRVIRANEIDVAVGRTKYAACKGEQDDCSRAGRVNLGLVEAIGATCSSACPLVLAGGARRLAGPATLVGLNYIPFLLKGAKAVDGQIGEYLSEMGISSSLLVEMKRVGGIEVRRLSVDESYDLRLTTSLDAAYLLTNVALCKASPAAGNCVDLSVANVKKATQ